MRRTRAHVALVAPFFGRDLRGRKERFGFAYATHLALEGVAVDVLTTTATPEAPDANRFRAGADNTEPFAILRFRVVAPDRVAYEEALIAALRGAAATESSAALLDERLRSPELLAHLRLAGDRYDAVLFLDLSVPTTVRAIAEVAERALLVPLLDDEPVVHLPAVTEAAARARAILCSSDAEARMAARLLGLETRAHTRVIGLAADTAPPADVRVEGVHRVTRGRPYVLDAGDGERVAFRGRAGELLIVRLGETEERDRGAFFTHALAVATAGEGRGFVPEVAEAWAYGKAVLAGAATPGAADLVRETGAGLVVADDGWDAALRALPERESLADLARAGTQFVRDQGGWPALAARTLEAIEGIAAHDGDRSRDALLAHIAYLYPLVQRQRRAIDAMRASRFWQLRDVWFAGKRRFRIGPAEDPLAIPDSEDRAAKLAALGEPYQLFREHHRLRAEDAERIAAMARFLPASPRFGLVIDARWSSPEALAPTLRSLRDQLYAGWSARVLVGAGAAGDGAPLLEAAAAGDARVVLVRGAEPWFDDADFVAGLDPGDRLEPHALFEFALTLQDDVDVAYCDEDRFDDHGVPGSPWFKPDWSPETLLTRDYVGKLCVLRRSLLEAAGGVRDVFESARWYEALLRVSEHSTAIAHIPEVLCHRAAHRRSEQKDFALAVEVALARRGEPASVTPVDGGVEVKFAVPGTERVCVIVPTRDRADLLRPCIASVFERTAYPEFEMIVVDNGSRERATHDLLAEWQAREPQRFRVLRDADAFNYSRLNNMAVRATDAPFVLLLNNDTEVVAAEWMAAMLGQARRSAIGAVGALLLYADRTVQHAGVVLGILGLAGHAHRFLPAGAPGYHDGLRFDTNYLAVTGACLMIEKRKYESIGGLDESMAVSYNDIDLCLRLRAAGYRNVFVPRATLIHYESKSRGGDDTPAKVARAMSETETIRTRWPAWSVRDPYYNPNLTVDAEDFGFRL